MLAENLPMIFAFIDCEFVVDILFCQVVNKAAVVFEIGKFFITATVLFFSVSEALATEPEIALKESISVLRKLIYPHYPDYF